MKRFRGSENFTASPKQEVAILSTTLWATQFLGMVDYRALEGSGHCCQLGTYTFLGLRGRAFLVGAIVWHHDEVEQLWT